MKTNTSTLKDAMRAGHSPIAPAPTAPSRPQRIQALRQHFRISCNCLDKASDDTLAILERAANAAPPAPPLSALAGKATTKPRFDFASQGAVI